MARKFVKFWAGLEMLLALAVYLSIRYTFKNDVDMFARLEGTDYLSTLLRLTIYIIPGLHLIGGLFGLTFKTKAVLVFMGFVELFAAYLQYSLNSCFTETLIVVLVAGFVAIAYIVSALLIKQEDIKED